MKLKFASALACALICLTPVASQAHRAWILPEATVLSSDDPWVTFDAAVSNDIFHRDYRAMGVNGLVAISPSGKEVELQNVHSGKYRTVFDINLTERGTYRVGTASDGLRARWETEDGQRRFWPGRGEAYTKEGFEQNVPKRAKNLEITQFSRRNETFVTAGAPSNEVLKATKKGFELVPVTHPNDLFAGEAAEFSFLYDGKPVAGVEVEVIPEGMRYRNEQASIKLTSNAKGIVSIEWPAAGRYWLNASYQDSKAKKPATSRAGGYTAVFEVLPE